MCNSYNVCLFAYSLSLSFQAPDSAPLKFHTSSVPTWMSSAIHQEAFPLILSLPISKCPNACRNLLCGNIFASTIRYFDVVNFTTVTTFTLLFSCQLSFQAVSLKITSLPNFSLKSPKNIDLVLGKLLEYLLYFLTGSVHWGNRFILSWCMCIQDINITSATLCPIYYIISLRTSTLLNADKFFLQKINLVHHLRF